MLHDPRLAVDLGAGLRLRNPVMPASGCFGVEMGALVDLDALGALVPKTIFYYARAGNPSPPAPPSFDRVALRRVLENAKATYVGSDLTACMAAAARALGESPVSLKLVWSASVVDHNTPPRYTL